MKSKLVDQYGRQIKYLRFSVTDRCDLRCKYCLPKGFKEFSEPENNLNFNEIEHLVALFAQMGVEHLRITGGEPLVRKGIEHLIASLASIPGISDLSLSTNAARKAELTPIKINCVLMKNVNENEVERILEYCAQRDFTLRLIEPMPIGNTGRSAQEQYLSLDSVKRKLQKRYNLIPDVMPGAGPARYYRLDGRSTRIGFITPISQHFCETCNRVRLSCEGDIYTCLGDETRYPLGSYLRRGCPDNELIEHIFRAVNLKPEKHNFLSSQKRIVRFMSMTGG